MLLEARAKKLLAWGWLASVPDDREEKKRLQMKVYNVRPHVQAAIPPQGSIISQFGCNVGLIHTAEGVILIDTSVSVKRLRLILEQANLIPEDICLAVITHIHADHTKGIKLLSCPVVCHARAGGYLKNRYAKTGKELITFKDRLDKEVGGVRLKIMHTGGHTPESLVVWLEKEKVLFSGDLIFSGTAPFLASTTNFKALVKSLRWLPSLGAEVIVPGHGAICDDDEVEKQIHYLENTWKVVEGHVAQGHPLSVIRKDPDLPILPGRNFERNIEWVYKRQSK